MGTEGESIGTATMAVDGTIVFELRIEFIHLGEIYFKYGPGSPNYDWALKYVDGLRPGEKKPIPAFDKRYYNIASMSTDGTIRLEQRPAELPGGGLSRSLVLYFKPIDPRYDETLKYIGHLEPGESKLVPPHTTTFFRTQ